MLSSKQLICSLTLSPVQRTLTDAYRVLALLLGSGNLANVMAFGLVKQRHGQPASLSVTGETYGESCLHGMLRKQSGSVFCSGLREGSGEAHLRKGHSNWALEKACLQGEKFKQLRQYSVAQGQGLQRGRQTWT